MSDREDKRAAPADDLRKRAEDSRSGG